jgi:O-antigen/teichoic acid export membrane protein
MKICAALVGFLTNAMVTRTLGAESAGAFFVGLSVVTISAVLARGGMELTLVRLVAQRGIGGAPNTAVAAVNSALVVALGIGSVFVVLIYGKVWLWGGVLAPPISVVSILPVFGLAIIPSSVTYLLGHAFQGMSQPYRFLLYQNFGVSLVFLIMLAATAMLSGGLSAQVTTEQVVESYVVGSALLALVAIFDWRAHAERDHSSALYPIRDFLRMSRAVLGVSLLAMLNQYLMQFFLAAWGTLSEVAIFAVAYRIAAVLTMVLAAMDSVIAPKFAQLHAANDLDGMRGLAAQSTRGMVIFGAPICAGMFVFPELTLSLFGAEFESGVSVLRILVIGQAFNVATGAVGTILLMSGNARLVMFASVAGVSSLVVFSSILVPQFGVEGAALAQAFALIIQMSVNTLAVYKKFGFAPIFCAMVGASMRK